MILSENLMEPIDEKANYKLYIRLWRNADDDKEIGQAQVVVAPSDKIHLEEGWSGVKISSSQFGMVITPVDTETKEASYDTLMELIDDFTDNNFRTYQFVIVKA